MTPYREPATLRPSPPAPAARSWLSSFPWPAAGRAAGVAAGLAVAIGGSVWLLAVVLTWLSQNFGVLLLLGFWVFGARGGRRSRVAPQGHWPSGRRR